MLQSASDRARRAALAEVSVLGRHLRRPWFFPWGRMAVITWPAPLRHRAFLDYNYWWQAHVMDALIDAEARDPQPGRRATIRRFPALLRVRNKGTLVNDYFDDIAWLALAMGRARDELGVSVGKGDRRIAHQLYGRWRSDAAGGGIPWRRGDAFRNVPANGTMAIVMARSGRLERTRDAVRWIYDHLYDSDTGMILEGRRPDGLDRRLYTYNQGLVLGALLELVVAGEQEWRPHLHELVETIRNRCAVDGVLNPCGGGDGGLFAAITARYLTLTAIHLPGDSDADRTARATAAWLVRASADAAWEGRAERDGEVWFADDWKERAEIPARSGGWASNTGIISSIPAGRDLSVQLAGWTIQELAARLDREGVPVA